MKNPNVIVSLCILVIFLASSTTSASDTTRVVWKNEPLSIDIATGYNARIIFPANVSIQLPVQLLDQLETLQVNPRIVYWKPHVNFENYQVIAISNDSEEVYLINLSSTDKGLKTPVTIEDPNTLLQEHSQESSTPKAPTREKAVSSDPPEIVLTRHVAQLLYAPLRLLPASRDIRRIPTTALPKTLHLKRTQRGELYDYEILGNWQGYGQYITAIKIKNLSPLSIDTIDLRTIRGDFTHIAVQHSSLSPANTPKDTTTLYLLSQKPFLDAVTGVSYGY